MDKSGEYSIFAEALRLTGLADSLLAYNKGKEYEMNAPMDNNWNLLYYPKGCVTGWTVFAEKDEVFRNSGINNISDLAAKCCEWYGNPVWFDLIKEQGITISTGADYDNEWNVLHMFVAYHIIRANIPIDKLVYEKNRGTAPYWNYCFGYEPQAYYETMLQGALLKVWQTNPNTTKELWLNRYVKNNTLTDQYATFGSDDMHPLLYEGAKINRNASTELMNASIHSINKVLLYNSNAYAAQHERMRFHINQMLPELASNGIMRAYPQEVSAWNNGGDGNRIALPIDYFNNLCCYDENTQLRYSVLGAWRALESTLLQGWKQCDFAIRLPRVPSGRYEIRYIYSPVPRGGELDFYLGNSNDTITMNKLSTLDTEQNPYDGNMGYQQIEYDSWSESEHETYGIEAGKAMRQKGYMYAPASFSRGTYNTITDKLTVTADDPYAACKQMTGSTSCRSEAGYGIMMLRYIIATVDVKQSEDCWLRIKNRATGETWPTELRWSFNFIELVPVDVAENETYMEDWY
jgi:uncharacterized surface protein with fasciclin (FAS1) repeats